MKPTREILGTINLLLAVIPRDDIVWENLRFGIKTLFDENAYTAPELQDWKRLCVLLCNSLPYPPETDWQKDVLAIIKGEKTEVVL
jgi:hypothetical protein